MLEKLQDPKFLLTILFFPMLFQGLFLEFAWGNYDIFWLMILKRTLILLPVLAIIFSCWATIVCILTVPFRQKRRQFISSLLVTWWDLGRALFSFWGGIVKFIFYLVGWIFNLLRIIVIGLWLVLQDVLLTPFRMAKEISTGYTRPGVPWLAVFITIGWAMLEALIFTFVMTPLVMDVLSGMASGELSETTIQLPLFGFLFIAILGSFAVMSTLSSAVKSRNVPYIVFIVFVEIIVCLFEVVFLYREFVDALVPWFAQHSGGNFQLGLIGTFIIATFAWLGIRGMTWFLFAGAGTPPIIAILKRTGLPSDSKSYEKGGTARSREELFAFIHTAIERIKKDMDWVHGKGEEILGAFILPPLQIVAACINFCTLFLFSNHLFELPFVGVKDLLNAKLLLLKVKKTSVEEA